MKRRNLNMIIKKDLRGLMNERTILLAVLLHSSSPSSPRSS